MRLIGVLLIGGVLVVTLPAAASSREPIVPQTTGSDVQIIAADDTGLTVQLTVPPYRVETVQRDGVAYQSVRVDAAGWSQAGAPGAPQLPERGLLLAVPPEGEVAVQVLQAQPAVVAERVVLPPAPTVRVSSAAAQGALGPSPLHESWLPDPAVYAADAWLPAAQVEISQQGWLRGMRFVRLALRPFQVNPARGLLQATPTLQVRLVFNQPAAAQQFLAADPVFDAILADTFPNYRQAMGWRVRPPAEPAPASAAERLAIGAGPWVKVTVKADGLYKVTYNDLVNAGVSLSGVDPRTFRLLDAGVEQHLYVAGEADGVFGSSDYFLFYGLRNTATLSNDKNVYWLTWGGASGQRMATRDGAPGSAAFASTLLTTARGEQNNTYNRFRPFADWLQPVDHDHWFWEQITSSKAIDLTGMKVATGSSVAPVLSVLLAGEKEDPGDYRVSVSLNGQPAGELSWTGQRLLQGGLALPAGLLVNGTNTVTLAPQDLIPNSQDDTVWLDWISLEYPYNGQFTSGWVFRNPDGGTWRYQITSVPTNAPWILNLATPSQPQRVVNAAASGSSGNYTLTWQLATTGSDRFVVVPDADIKAPLQVEKFVDAGILDAAQQVDYLIISHKDFLSTVQPLADFHAGQGLSVRTVDVQQVYDQFSDGSMRFEAIRDYLAYTYTNYQWPPPTYVLLVGDGTIDFRDYQIDNTSLKLTNWIPPYVGAFDFWEGTSISESAFAYLQGDDVLPEMLVGRFPVNNTSEAQLLVDKTKGYLTATPGDWTLRTLWVADNPDEAGDFHAASDQTITHLLPEFQVTKVYYTPTNSSPGTCGYGRPVDVCSANQQIIDAINLGQLLINFSGHGTYGAWAHEWLFINPDVDKLTNTNSKLGFTVISACATAYFARYDNNGLEERMMRRSGGGIVGGFAPTTFDMLSSQTNLVQHFYDAVMEERLTTVGQAGAMARNRTFGELPPPFSEITAVGHAVMGDPALKLQRPADTCAEGDVDCDGDVDIVDVQRVAGAWNSSGWGDPGYNPRYDLDGNRLIDVNDIIAVANLWGTLP